MSSNYPNSIDSYSAKEDGVDVIAASHINNLQDAIVAIETELGTTPKGNYTSVANALAKLQGYELFGPYRLMDILALLRNGWFNNVVNWGGQDQYKRADFIQPGVGLAVQINADIEIEMDIKGYFQNITESGGSGGLPASSTCYIYAQRSEDSLVPSISRTTLKPVYSFLAPLSPATDQHWYDLAENQMKRWGGSDWQEVSRIFIGEAETDATSVTSTTTYAIKGRYDSGWFGVNANTKYTITHNLGRLPLNVELYGATDINGANCHKVGYYQDNGAGYGGMIWDVNEKTVAVNDDTSGFDFPIRYGASTSASSGFYRVVVATGF